MAEDMSKTLTIIGRAEQIRFLDYASKAVPAKVDTGADVSSIWASQIREASGTVSFVLFDKTSPYYTGQLFTVDRDHYRLTRIANSFGDRELRYVVKLRIELLGRRIRASFTLADRSNKIYPVLLGRRLLTNKFIVDVTQGTPLLREEAQRLQQLHVALSEQAD